MAFWDDAIDIASYANPFTAAQNLLPDEVNGVLWPQGNVMDALGLGGSPTAPEAAPLTPEQQAAVTAGFANPSTQQPITGYSQPQPIFETDPATGKPTQVGWSQPQPQYGPSVRDQAMAGFNAGPREAPQAQVNQAQRPIMATPQNVQGATINPNATAQGDKTTAMGLGMTRTFTDASGQARRDQSAQTQRLTNAAEGNAPSVAENQLRSGLAQGMQNSLAMAASSRGSGSGAVLAQRQAANNNAALGARTNAQAAQLRAGEMAQARGDLTNQLAGVRGQDIQTAGLGTNVAGIGVQQAGIGAQLGTANAGFQQQANLANQQTQLATGTANLNAATQTNLANLSAAQQTSLANAQLVMQQQGMDDAQKMAYLGAVLGIDARSQQGQQQLQQLLAQYKLQTDATNAGIGINNANAAVNQQNGLLSAGATLGAALI